MKRLVLAGIWKARVSVHPVRLFPKLRVQWLWEDC